MSEDLENLTREELITRLKEAEKRPVIDPNSMASVLLMDGKDAPAHYIKNVMHPGFKVLFILIAVPLACIFLFLGIMFLIV